VGAAVLATLLTTMMTFSCVVAGGELWVRETLNSPREAWSCQYRGCFFQETFSPRFAFDCCIFVAGAPVLSSLCHWGLASPQELLFSCDGEVGVGVGVRGGADDVDNDVGDGIGDGFGGSVTFTGSAELSGPWLIGGVARSCLDRDLLAALAEKPPLFFLVVNAEISSLFYHHWCGAKGC